MNIGCFYVVLVLFSMQRYAEQVDIKQSLIEKYTQRVAFRVQLLTNRKTSALRFTFRRLLRH